MVSVVSKNEVRPTSRKPEDAMHSQISSNQPYGSMKWDNETTAIHISIMYAKV